MEFKHINKKTDLSQARLCPWDSRNKKKLLDVYDVEDYIHTYGGRLGICGNSYWCCPRGAKPSHENLTPFLGHPVDWSIKVEEYNSFRLGNNFTKNDEVREHLRCMIYRNDEPFYRINFGREINTVLLAAQKAILEFQEHPINFTSQNWREEVLNRKVYWNDQPGIITQFSEPAGDFIIEPDGIEGFRPHAHYNTENERQNWIDDYGNGLKTDYLDNSIWWFRN